MLKTARPRNVMSGPNEMRIYYVTNNFSRFNCVVRSYTYLLHTVVTVHCSGVTTHADHRMALFAAWFMRLCHMRCGHIEYVHLGEGTLLYHIVTAIPVQYKRRGVLAFGDCRVRFKSPTPVASGDGNWDGKAGSQQQRPPSTSLLKVLCWKRSNRQCIRLLSLVNQRGDVRREMGLSWSFGGVCDRGWRVRLRVRHPYPL